MSQTSFSQDMAIALPGLLVGTGPKEILPRKAEVAMDFGYLVVQGTDDDEVKLPTATGQKPVGIVVRDMSVRDEAAANDVLVGESCDVLTSGTIRVQVEGAVTPGGAVFFRHTGGDEGRFRADADTSNADELAGARFLTSASADGFATISLNLPS
jgi:hypothetical protein